VTTNHSLVTWMKALAVLGQSLSSCRQSQLTFSKISRGGTFLECRRAATGAGGDIRDAGVDCGRRCGDS
jgi:hypothetical protein